MREGPEGISDVLNQVPQIVKGVMLLAAFVAKLDCKEVFFLKTAVINFGLSIIWTNINCKSGQN